MKYVLALAGLIALAGCAESATAPSATGYTTTAELRVLNRATGRLEVIPPELLVATGLSLSTAASQSLPAFTVASTSPLLSSGFTSSALDYADNGGKLNHVKEFWCRSGGPVCSHYHIVNGKMLTATAFKWTPIAGGYLNTLAVTTIYAPSGAVLGTGTVIGTYTVTTKPCNPKVTTCGPPTIVFRDRVRHAFGRAVLKLALATSSPALAQWGMHFTDCPLEWAAYVSTSLALGSATAAAVADWPLIGAAYIANGAALWYLEVCMQRGDTGPSPLFPGGGGGKSNGLASGQQDECSSGGGGCLVAYTE